MEGKMTLLRKMYFGFMPLFLHVLEMGSALHMPRFRIRLRYPRLLLGFLFLIILLAILFALPPSASTQPYLTVQDVPVHAPTWMAVNSGGTNPLPASLDPPIGLPVTGN